ncbi:hypothetical protein Dimus_004254 [Dionaea muscipula]
MYDDELPVSASGSSDGSPTLEGWSEQENGGYESPEVDVDGETEDEENVEEVIEEINYWGFKGVLKDEYLKIEGRISEALSVENFSEIQ